MFGLLSKPMLVTTPFVLLLLDYWPIQRLRFPLQKSDLRALLPLLCEKIPFFALGIASSVITFVMQRKGGAVSTSISFTARFANALISYLRYLGKTFWPAKLSILYPHPGHWPVWQVVLAALALLTASGLIILAARSRPWITMGWLWFLGMLVPVIGLIQVGIQSMADRYTYLPLIGIFIAIVWTMAEIVFPAASRKTPGLSLPKNPFALALLPIGILSIAVLAALTRFQLQHWRNSETLFRHAVQVTANNYLAYNNLGFFLSSQGKVDEAIENYRRSIEINPAYEDAQNNLGYALAAKKKYPEAIEHYYAALRTRPNHTEVHNNLGNALAEMGQTDEAIAHYLVVLKQSSNHADAHNNLGIALAMKGNLVEAVPHFQAAIRFKKNYASAHSNLGNALAALHRFDEAVAQYEECLQLNPNDAQAHNNLANVLAEQGNVEKAVSHYLEALRLNSDNPEVHYNLGLAFMRQGKAGEARAHFLEALRLKPDYTEPRKQLESLGKAANP
jgi:tetratricopeptide (TPR) repeat protein